MVSMMDGEGLLYFIVGRALTSKGNVEIAELLSSYLVRGGYITPYGASVCLHNFPERAATYHMEELHSLGILSRIDLPKNEKSPFKEVNGYRILPEYVKPLRDGLEQLKKSKASKSTHKDYAHVPLDSS